MKASMISFLTIFGLSMLAATPAKSEMILVSGSKNRTVKSYVDTNSITFDRHFVEALVKFKYTIPSKGGTSLAMTRLKVNCSYRSYILSESKFYDLNGIFLLSNRKPSGWIAIKPNSASEDVYNFMCNQFRH